MSLPDTISLRRPRPPRAVISLVPMIDVLLILLVFFMVTSTYLDLDMIPAAGQPDEGRESTPDQRTASGAPVMIRLGADGIPTIQGVAQTQDSLVALISERVSDDPALQVIILPSGAAEMQSLVSVMDLATQAGASRLRVIRIEARP